MVLDDVDYFEEALSDVYEVQFRGGGGGGGGHKFGKALILLQSCSRVSL